MKLLMRSSIPHYGYISFLVLSQLLIKRYSMKYFTVQIKKADNKIAYWQW